MYKNNSRDNSKFKGYSPLQLSCNLTVKCHAIGYYSYTNRYKQAEETNPDTMNKKFLLHKEKDEKVKPAHKSKSVAALPCNRPFAATHMLFAPTFKLKIHIY